MSTNLFRAALALLLCLARETYALDCLTPDMVGTIGASEHDLWFQANKAGQILQDSGKVVVDPVATKYVQHVADRLYPEWSGQLHVAVVNDAVYNAFAMPNGAFYIHSGLLSRIENEAQLATILGHEVGHFVCRHSYQRANGASNAAGITVLLLAVNPIAALLGAGATRMGLYGYSRDHEREADRIGFERMVKAGYEPLEAVKVFQVLDEEARGAKTPPSPYMFATHPQLAERIENFQHLIDEGNLKGGEVGAEAFLQATHDLRVRQLERDVQGGRYGQTILALAKPGSERRYGDIAYFYLGESYRMRREAGDAVNAVAAYKNMLDREPSHPGALRGLGLLAYREQKWTEANDYFNRYLELAGDLPEAAFVRQLVAKVAEQQSRAAGGGSENRSDNTNTLITTTP